jgi:hypothetical protein
VLRGLIVIAALFAALAVPAASAPTKLVHFQTPSGNINCLGGTTPSAFVDCLVKSSTWPYNPPKPASCDLDWAPNDIALGHHKVSVGSCRGDIGPLCGPSSGDTCSTLAYGKSVTIGPIRCTSAADGVTCAYTSAPRTGFKIAREGFSVFHS